ncbi:MAG: hypothetical protein QXO37_05145 [Candidatus Nitrosocaldaceae archaeon]
MQSNELKRKLLDMLGEDKEFRHAVAGVIGYKEILDKFADLEARMDERFASMQEDMNNRFLAVDNRFLELETRMDERFASMQEDMNNRFLAVDNRFLELETRMDERFAKIEEEIRDLREESNNLRKDMQEGFRRHDEEFVKLRQDMQEGFKRMDKRLRYIESYIERTSLTLEEEARDVIEHRLKDRGISLSISRLELADIEIDIYGVDTDRCIIGEVKTRASPNVIEDVDNDIERLCNRYPQYLRKKVIKVIYAMQVAEEAIKEAEKRKIWVVTARKDLTPLVV